MGIKLQKFLFAIFLSIAELAVAGAHDLDISNFPEIQQQSDFFFVKREIINRLGAEYRGNNFHFSNEDIKQEIRRAEYLYLQKKEKNPFQYPEVGKLFYKKQDLYRYVDKKIKEHQDWILYTQKFMRKYDLKDYQHYPNLTINKPFSQMFSEFMESEQLELQKWLEIAQVVRQNPDQFLLNGPYHPHEITGVDQLHAQGLDGNGAEVIVWDCGFVNNKNVTFCPNDKHVVKPKTKKDFSDNEEHGTHVSGIIAAHKKCGMKKGVACNASVLPVDYASIPELIDRIKGSKSKVINASFHFLLNPDNFNYLDQLANELEKNDRLLVMASGNESNYLTPDLNPNLLDMWRRGLWVGTHNALILKKNPILAKHCLLVGSLMEDGTTISYFSNLPGILNDHFLFAPGENVLSTVAFDKFAQMSGTSMATPHVSGILTLVSKYYPNLNSQELKMCALKSCDPFWQDSNAKVQHGHRPEVFGAGRINAVKAMELARQLSMAKEGFDASHPNSESDDDYMDVSTEDTNLLNVDDDDAMEV